jgi:hypothetical protein
VPVIFDFDDPSESEMVQNQHGIMPRGKIRRRNFSITTGIGIAGRNELAMAEPTDTISLSKIPPRFL